MMMKSTVFDAKYMNRHALIMLITMSISDDKFNDWNERQKKMKIIKMPLESNC